MTGLQSLIILIGRILLSAIFVTSGVQKLTALSETAEGMQSEGVVAAPFLLAAAIICELCGGLSVLLGWHARFGALLLIAFLVPVTLIYHDFWQKPEQEQQMAEMIHFSKNLAILGGLFVVLACGGGRFSISHRRPRTPPVA